MSMEPWVPAKKALSKCGSANSSYLSTNDKGDNEIKLGAVHRSPGIYLTVEENSKKLQSGEHGMKAMLPDLKWGLFTFINNG